MKAKIETALALLRQNKIEDAAGILQTLVENYDSLAGKAFASKGGKAGKGDAKKRSPAFYKELAQKGVEARRRKRAEANKGSPPISPPKPDNS